MLDWNTTGDVPSHTYRQIRSSSRFLGDVHAWQVLPEIMGVPVAE